ncbi:MAG: 16S rRNA (cytidine(1402)-2'-O)-methyltransferase, partial [Hyphomonadaceae bacterium]
MTPASLHPEPAADPKEARSPRPSGKSPPDSPLEPGLYVVATPIGNLRDITVRALDVLAGAARIYAEDTRVARKLLDAYAIATPLSAYHDHSAPALREAIVAAIGRGEALALVSDAGTPLISDPGFKLARAVIEAGARVFPVPGASALLAALVGAGLPTDRFFFAGFAPAKAGARRAWLEDLAAIPATLVFYETGPRLAESLADMAAAFGPRPAVIARELTKMFEEFRRDDLASLAASYAAAPPKGEIVVLVEGPPEAPPTDEATLDAFLREAL